MTVVLQQDLGSSDDRCPSGSKQARAYDAPFGSHRAMLQRILIALDGGAASDAAISHAIALAVAMGAEVEAIFVVDGISPFLHVKVDDPVQLVENLKIAGESVLAAAGTRLNRSGVKYSTRLLIKDEIQEDVSTDIASEANGWPADLIIIGYHEYAENRHWFTVDVVGAVMARTEIPVLLVKNV